MRVRTHIGTSGWQYDDWRGVFYPDGVPQRDWLAFYAERFGTVEVNNSFYRLRARHVRTLEGPDAARVRRYGEGEQIHHPPEAAEGS